MLIVYIKNIGRPKLDDNISIEYCSTNVSFKKKYKYLYYFHSYYSDINDKNSILSYSFNKKFMFHQPYAINIYMVYNSPRKKLNYWSKSTDEYT